MVVRWGSILNVNYERHAKAGHEPKSQSGLLPTLSISTVPSCVATARIGTPPRLASAGDEKRVVNLRLRILPLVNAHANGKPGAIGSSREWNR